MRRAATWVARVLGVAKGPQADGKGQCHLPCCLSSACAGSTSRGDRCSRRRASCRGSTVRRRGAPPPPFERVARWGAAHLRLLGCAARGSGLAAGGVTYSHASHLLSRVSLTPNVLSYLLTY